MIDLDWLIYFKRKLYRNLVVVMRHEAPSWLPKLLSAFFPSLRVLPCLPVFLPWLSSPCATWPCLWLQVWASFLHIKSELPFFNKKNVDSENCAKYTTGRPETVLVVICFIHLPWLDAVL